MFSDFQIWILELETGVTQNESVTWAVRSAVEAAVLAMIEQGDQRGFWTLEANNIIEEIIITPVKTSTVDG